jgi:predicted DNA-binding transcriptional regulator AlpA
MAAPKARQLSKIKAIGETLANMGYLTLDQQAKVLGLSRSTTWTLLRCSHKASGLSVRVINQMLASPQLPQPVRNKIVEYLKDRLAGHHGHSRPQLQKFATRLSLKVQPTAFERINELHSHNSPDAWSD